MLIKIIIFIILSTNLSYAYQLIVPVDQKGAEKGTSSNPLQVTVVSGGSGSQTPWTSNIDGGGYTLSNVSSVNTGQTADGNITAGTGYGINLITNSSTQALKILSAGTAYMGTATSPTALFEFNSDTRVQARASGTDATFQANGTGVVGFQLKNSTGTKVWEVTSKRYSSNGFLEINNVTDALNFLTMDFTGKIGVFNLTPAYNLDVTGSVNSTTSYVTVPSAKATVATTNAAWVQTNNASNPFALRTSLTGAAAIANRVANLQTTDVNLADGGTIALQPSAGGVTIGTTTPATGKFNIAGSTGIGWTVKTGANTACNTTCPSTSACVHGWAAAVTGSDPVSCTDATADSCLCAGP